MDPTWVVGSYYDHCDCRKMSGLVCRTFKMYIFNFVLRRIFHFVNVFAGDENAEACLLSAFLTSHTTLYIERCDLNGILLLDVATLLG